MPSNPYDWFPEAPRLLAEATADKIEAHPELLRVPLENIDRWIALGSDAVRRLEQWREIIFRAQASREGMAELLALLRDDGESARHLKSYSPFAGVLEIHERRRTLEPCTATH